MEIRRIDSTSPVVEHTSHDDREHAQKRYQPRKKDKTPSVLVYRPDGKLEEEPPPKIDVLV
jgi:hypothetical protein